MTGKELSITIWLDVHAVTCPGVWLCPNGAIALRIKCLGNHLVSRRVPPAFPLLLHERFVLQKLLVGVRSLTEIEKRLEQRALYAELVQWVNPGSSDGIILAKFERTLTDLLYPLRSSESSLSDVVVELLMEPTKYFPGIIVPKIEISTKTLIEEMGRCDIGHGDYLRTLSRDFPSAKTTDAKCHPCPTNKKRMRNGIIRQKKVCHSRDKCASRVPSNEVNCSCENINVEHQGIPYQHIQPSGINTVDENYMNYSSVQNASQRAEKNRRDAHDLEDCPVCTKFDCYFFKTSGCREDEEEHAGDKYRQGRCMRHEEFQYATDNNREHWTEVPEIARSNQINYRMNSMRCCPPYSAGDQDLEKRCFYKNLERFYKGMYVHAKCRARGVQPNEEETTEFED